MFQLQDSQFAHHLFNDSRTERNLESDDILHMLVTVGMTSFD